MNNRFLIKILLILAALEVLLKIFSLKTEWVERFYSNGIYPILQCWITTVTGFIPFTLFEWIIAGCVLVSLWILIKWPVLWFRKRISFPKAFGSMLLRMSVFLLVIHLWFLVCWGLNYNRQSLADKFDFINTDAEEAQFLAVSGWANSQMIQLYRNAPFNEVEEAVASALESLDVTLAMMRDKVPRTKIKMKRFIWNYPMNSTLTYGMISPFTLEPHISTALFPEEIPFYAAHEAAHIRGYASETEANFLAFEACIESDNPLAKFSGFFCIHHYLTRSIPKDDRSRLYNSWPKELKELLARIIQRDKENRGVFLDISRKIYDLYLKSNSQKEGIRTYSMVGGWIVIIHYRDALAAARKKLESTDNGNDRDLEK